MQEFNNAIGGHEYSPLKRTQEEKKRIHKIHRFSGSVAQNTGPPSDSVDQQRDDSGHRAQAGSASQLGNLSDILNAWGISKEEFKDFPRFGPSYGDENEVIMKYKEHAWRQVVEKTGGEEGAVYSQYLGAIKTEKIEKEAKETYDPPILDRLLDSTFWRMMIVDGCYFLQLALYILEGSKLLGYPENDTVFGTTDKEDKISRWIKAMYFPGNQIPYVVISELLKQTFFQDVIKRGREQKVWSRPSNLPERVLYLLVVKPKLDKNGPRRPSWFFSKCQEKAPHHFVETPSELLHGLHCIVAGPASDPLDWEDFDLEAGNRSHEIRFPNAKVVQEAGIILRKANDGIREIQFSRNYFVFPKLDLPPFTFDSKTQLMLQYLKSYEIAQKIHKSKSEVTAYLRFMSDLIQTDKDVEILKSRGILEVKEDINADELPEMLNKLGSSNQIALTRNLRRTRRHIENHFTTTRNLMNVAYIIFFLTLVQTAFTILAYVCPTPRV